MVVFTSGDNNRSSNTILCLSKYNCNYNYYINYYKIIFNYFFFLDEKNDENYSESFWKQLLQPDVLRPFRLLLMYFLFSNILSGVPYAPYLIEVFTIFGANVDVEWTIVSLINND